MKSEIMKLIPITRAEKGCMNYNLFEDNKDETCFLLQETWETHAEWQAHMDNTHMGAYSKATENAVETWELIELSQMTNQNSSELLRLLTEPHKQNNRIY